MSSSTPRLGRPGIVRAARRPDGWQAPGPRPAGDGDGNDPTLHPGPDEDLCYLVGDWRIFQRQDGHRWSMDDLVTAHLAVTSVAAPPVRTLDLGCGVGSVLMAVAWAFPDARALGLEAQPLSADLTRRSLRWNGAAPRVVVRDGDLRDPAALPEGAIFDLVTGTPPYFDPAAGTESDQVQRAPCRFEHRGGGADYVAAAARALAPGGTFVTCNACFQAEGMVAAATAHGLAVVRQIDVVPRVGKAPLIALFVMRHAIASTTVAPVETLVVRDADGQWTPTFRAVRARMGMPPPLPPRAR